MGHLCSRFRDAPWHVSADYRQTGTNKTTNQNKKTMTKKKTKRKSKTESLVNMVNNRRIDLTPEQVDTIITERGLVFIDPLSDFGFKRLLGMERTKDITIHLLNTFMSDDTGVITDITFISSEQVGLLPGRRRFAWTSTVKRRTATISS